MSAPAAKAFWDPVRRMHRVEGRELKCVRAVLSSVIRGVERALRALGRLSVTVGVNWSVRQEERRDTLAYSWSWL